MTLYVESRDLCGGIYVLSCDFVMSCVVSHDFLWCHVCVVSYDLCGACICCVM